MAVSDRLNKKKYATVSGGIVFFFGRFLRKLLKGMPLDKKNGEVGATIMLSPGLIDTKIYIVALTKERKIVRVCEQYSAKDLGVELLCQMQAHGVDVDAITQGFNMPQPVNED